MLANIYLPLAVSIAVRRYQQVKGNDNDKTLSTLHQILHLSMIEADRRHSSYTRMLVNVEKEEEHSLANCRAKTPCNYASSFVG